MSAPQTGPPPPSSSQPSTKPASKSRSRPRSIPLHEIQSPLLSFLNAGQRFATGPEGVVLYRYENGVYRPEAEEWVESQAFRWMEARGWRGYWSTHLIRNVLSAMRVNRLRIPRRPPSGRVNLLNGVLDLSTLELHAHSPDDIWTVQVPLHYDPDAPGREWDWYLNSIFPEDTIPLAYEMFGACLTSDRITEEAIWLIADGGNGKSTFLENLTTFLGPENVSNLSVQDIHDGGFALSELEGKLLNIDDDATYSVLKDPAILKKIIAGAPLWADIKYKQGHTMHPFCKILLAANNPPQSTDLSWGWERRNLYLKMSKFCATQANRITKEEIASRICVPHELSGMLNKAIEGWRRFKSQREFTKPESLVEYTEEIRDKDNLIPEFLDRYIEFDPSNKEEFLPTEILAYQINHYLRVFEKPKVDNRRVMKELEKKWPKFYRNRAQKTYKTGAMMRGIMGMQSSYPVSVEIPSVN